MDADELMMLALDAGAEDFNEDEESYEILTDPDTFSDVAPEAGRGRHCNGSGRGDDDPADIRGTYI